MSELTQKRCVPCEGGVTPMTNDQIQKYLKELPEWQLGYENENSNNDRKIDENQGGNNDMNNRNNDGNKGRDKIAFIYREFTFKNYYKTMAFVNAVAWIAHQENHHPDLSVGYNRCLVRYSTHAIQGLSENDFICAAKVDALM